MKASNFPDIASLHRQTLLHTSRRSDADAPANFKFKVEDLAAFLESEFNLYSENSTLGTFAGSIISDNQKIKDALQELESYMESMDLTGIDLNWTSLSNAGQITAGTGTPAVIPAVSTLATGLMLPAHKAKLDFISVTQAIDLDQISGGATNLGVSVGSDSITITSDTGTDAIIPEATNDDPGLMSAAHRAKVANIGITQFVDLDVQETRNSRLITLSGRPANSQHLGSFAGSTIPNNRTIKKALQDLETFVEGISGGATNLGITTASNFVTITSDTGTDATINGATSSNAGLMLPIHFTKVNHLTVSAAINLDDLSTNTNNLVLLSGMPANSNTLGAFTGSIIPNSPQIKSALQSLETHIESKLFNPGNHIDYNYSGDQHNWAVDLSKDVLRLSEASNGEITGFVAPTSGTKMFFIANVGTSSISFVHESSSSVADNRFNLRNATDASLLRGACVWCWYDETANRWMLGTF